VYYLPSIKAAKLYIISWHRDKKSIPWMLCQCQTCNDYIRDFYVLEQGEHTSHWTWRLAQGPMPQIAQRHTFQLKYRNNWFYGLCLFILGRSSQLKIKRERKW